MSPNLAIEKHRAILYSFESVWEKKSRIKSKVKQK